MKGQPFFKRLAFAWNGIVHACAHERSFRTQLMLAAATLLLTAWLSPPLVWIALITLAISLVLGAELLNTALEHLLDGMHPAQAPFVRIAKDCAAAAVLLFAIAAAIVFLLMLRDVKLLP